MTNRYLYIAIDYIAYDTNIFNIYIAHDILRYYSQKIKEEVTKQIDNDNNRLMVN